MKREFSVVRADSKAKLEEIGLSFHEWDGYWNENVRYHFTAREVDTLEEVTEELHGMCLKACQYIVDNNLFSKLAIPEAYWDAIKHSWNNRELSIYGRFDLAYDGVHAPKMLEYNADTPTSLLESAVAQWYWMEDVQPTADQFNSLHERLVARWKKLPAMTDIIHFASLKDNEEDWVCTHYLMETALQAGFTVKHVNVEDLGYDSESKYFVDQDDERIDVLFKLYPWEWMMHEQYGIETITTNTRFVEPMWKAMLSNKGILPILWELFPDHPNLLPAFFEADKLTSYAKKPLFSREGANIELIRDGEVIASDTGVYGEEGYIYQQLFDMKSFEGKYPVIGSWIVGDEPAGMCIREDVKKITTNMSNFIPHYFTEEETK